MKKVISTQGLSYGEFYDENMTRAIKERVCPRLEHHFYQWSGEEVRTKVTFSISVMDGEVENIYLSFDIDNPTHERLSNFRDTCNIFFCLDGFKANYEIPHVFFAAADTYDMGMLIHALEVMTVSLESVVCIADEEDINHGAIYTPSGGTIVRVPNVTKYRIKEGTQFMAPNALEGCSRLRQLDIPYGTINHYEILKSAPKVKYKEWTTLYDGTLPDEEGEEEDNADEDFTLDEHHVAYSRDGKKLLFAHIEFCETRYEVPDGVEEIDDFAFCCCNTYVELSLPRSIRIIGDSLFGNGGHIEIRDK